MSCLRMFCSHLAPPAVFSLFYTDPTDKLDDDPAVRHFALLFEEDSPGEEIPLRFALPPLTKGG